MSEIARETPNTEDGRSSYRTINTVPPFTYVGLDVFGPWQVTTRKTRGGAVHSKCWAVIFTCLTIRAIHVELIESMDTSSFINAVRQFFAIRGPAAQLRSDNRTNFVGAYNELNATSKEMDNNVVDTYLRKQRCEWIFNPPHGSHIGGVWERMIGIDRKILNSMLADLGSRRLTHEVLSTLMTEVMAIVCMYVCKTLFQYANFDNYLQLVSTKGVYTQRAKC